MRPVTAVLLCVIGLGLTVAVCTALGVPPNQGMLLIGVSAGSALIVGLVGTLLLRLLAHTAFGAQMAVVVGAGVGAVTAGTVAAARSMLLSTADVHSLVVAVLAAGTVGALAALVLAGRVRVAQASLAATARRFEGSEAPPDAGAPPIREFAAIVSDLEATRERLARSRQRERDLEAARRDLVSWLSHDLRTPLAGIRALAEALEDGVASDPATAARYRRQLGEQAERVADMVEDLFALSRIHAGAFELERTRVALGDLLSDAVAAMEPLATRAEVRIEGHGGAPVDVDVGPREITRVLDNLLSNAVRETPAGGRVAVQLDRVAGWAGVTVIDGCGGIPDEVIARVFEAGFRGASARSPEAASRGGFGLAIAKGLAEAHGGTLEVGNVAGGCAFRLRLPVADAVPSRQPPSTTAERDHVLRTDDGHAEAHVPSRGHA